MPRRDVIHQAVVSALRKDRWTITADPYLLQYGADDLFIDLAAERLLAAELGERKIAVEIKSFLGRSTLTDLQQALGQYALYLSVLETVEPERKLYLAISENAHAELKELATFHLVVRRYAVALLVVAIPSEEIVQWIE